MSQTMLKVTLLVENVEMTRHEVTKIAGDYCAVNYFEARKIFEGERVT